MPPFESTYSIPHDAPSSVVREGDIESAFIGTLQGLKCNGNGYIRHTTGRGKALASFKTSTLLKEDDHIHKCVFVVHRKGLDGQTREALNSERVSRLVYSSISYFFPFHACLCL